MTRFSNIFEWMLPWECTFLKGHVGDYNYVSVENDASDPGGRTKFGLDHRSHPDINLDQLTLAEAKQVYLDSYWSLYGCEDRAYPMGEVIFNCAVNAGYGRVQKILAVLGVNATAKGFLDEQEAFYRRLVQARPSSTKFLKGWLNRTRALRAHLGLSV